MALRSASSLGRQTRSLAAVFHRTCFQFQPFSAKAAEVEGDIVKEAFVKQQTQLRSYLQELRKVKIPLDSGAQAVKDFAEEKKKIRQKVGVPSAIEKLNEVLEAAADDSDTVRAFLEKSFSLRNEFGIVDDLGAEPLMFDALESVETKIGKPLALDDLKGIQAWQEALNSVNAKLGLSENDLEKLEQKVEFDMVKEEVAKMRGEAEEKISTYKRRDGLDGVQVDIKEIDPRAYL